MWQLPRQGIDSKREQPVEVRVAGGQVDSALTDQIPIKRFKMSQVENNPMPFRDGPFVQRVGADHGK